MDLSFVDQELSIVVFNSIIRPLQQKLVTQLTRRTLRRDQAWTKYTSGKRCTQSGWRSSSCCWHPWPRTRHLSRAVQILQRRGICRETKEDQHTCAAATATTVTSRTNTHEQEQEPVRQESSQQLHHYPVHRRCSSSSSLLIPLALSFLDDDDDCIPHYRVHSTQQQR